MVLHRTCENKLQYEEILTLLIFTLSYQLLQLFSFLTLHLSLPLFNVILKSKKNYQILTLTSLISSSCAYVRLKGRK